MDATDRPGYYAVIPAEVRYDRSLTPNARLLYAEITALLGEDGYCFASNAYFANLYQVNERTISRWIGDLRDKGYVTVHVERDASGKVILRKIRIAVSAPDGQPVDNFVYTPGQKCQEGVDKNVQYTNLSNTNTKENKKEKSGKSARKEIIDPMPLFKGWIAETFPDRASQEKNGLYFAFDRLVKNRATTRHPLQTKPAVTALCNRLMRYTGGDVAQMIDLLDTAVDNGWQTVYPRNFPAAPPAAYKPRKQGMEYEEV